MNKEGNKKKEKKKTCGHDRLSWFINNLSIDLLDRLLFQLVVKFSEEN